MGLIPLLNKEVKVDNYGSKCDKTFDLFLIISLIHYFISIDSWILLEYIVNDWRILKAINCDSPYGCLRSLKFSSWEIKLSECIYDNNVIDKFTISFSIKDPHLSTFLQIHGWVTHLIPHFLPYFTSIITSRWHMYVCRVN